MATNYKIHYIKKYFNVIFPLRILYSILRFYKSSVFIDKFTLLQVKGAWNL